MAGTENRRTGEARRATRCLVTLGTRGEKEEPRAFGSRLSWPAVAENSASVSAHGVRSRVGVGYVVTLRYAGGCDGRSACSIASRCALGRSTPLGDAFGLTGGLAQ